MRRCLLSLVCGGIVCGLLAGLLGQQAGGQNDKKPTGKGPDVPAASPGTPASAPTAVPAEIARWIKELGNSEYEVREKASKALEQAGAAAVEGLAAAAKHADPEIRSRAAFIRERIEVNIALTPTYVTLKLKDIAVPKAVEELSRQSRLKLDLIPQQGPAREQLEAKRVRLELERVPFWSALDKLCEAAGLMYSASSPRRLQLQLATAAPPRVPTAYDGAFRARVTALTYTRGLNLIAAGGESNAAGAGAAKAIPARSERLQLSLDLIGEPHVTVLGVGTPQIVAAQDESGQSLVTEAGPVTTTNYSRQYSSQPVLQAIPLQAGLRPSARPGAALKLLKLAVPVDVLVQRRPLLRVEDIHAVKGRVVKGEGDTTLVILEVQRRDDNQGGTLRFAVTGIDKSPEEKNAPNYGNQGEIFRPRFDLTDAEGRPYILNIELNNPYYYGGISGSRPPEDVFEGRLNYSATPDLGPAAKLTFYGIKKTRTTVAFEFRDVPMP